MPIIIIPIEYLIIGMSVEACKEMQSDHTCINNCKECKLTKNLEKLGIDTSKMKVT